VDAAAIRPMRVELPGRLRMAGAGGRK
jgi:hypothetical protein